MDGLKRIPDFLGRLGGTEGSRGTFSAISEGANAVGDALSDAGPSGMVAGAAIKLGGALFDSVNKLDQWNSALRESERQMAEVSGAMAQVHAQAEVRDIMRDQASGEARADSAGGREDAMADLLDTVRPIADFFANIFNDVIAEIAGFLKKIMEVIIDLAEMIGIEIRSRDADPLADPFGGGGTAEAMRDFDAVHGVPARWAAFGDRVR